MSIRDWFYDILTGGDHSKLKRAEERLEAKLSDLERRRRELHERYPMKPIDSRRARMREQISNDVPMVMQQPVYSPPSECVSKSSSHSSSCDSCRSHSSCSGSSSCSTSSSSCGGGGGD